MRTLALVAAIVALLATPAAAQLNLSNTPPETNYGNMLFIVSSTLTTGGTWDCADGDGTCTTTGGDAQTEVDLGDWVAFTCDGKLYPMLAAREPVDANTFTIAAGAERIPAASWPCSGAAYLLSQGASAAPAALYDGLGHLLGLKLGTSGIAQVNVNAAGGSANPYDYTGTLGIMDGSDTFELFDINLTNANHTGGSNTVNIFNVANITGDANADEVAWYIGSGWDYGIQSVSGIRIGTGSTPDVTPGDDDLFVEGTVEVDGATRLDGALTVNADATMGADTTGGNAGAKNELIGLPRIKLIGFGQGTNGAAGGKTVILTDDTPDGEWSAHDGDTTVTADTAYYRAGAKSLGVLFTVAADAGDGAHDAVVAEDFSDDESVGMWVYCDGAFSAGDLVLELTDDGGAHALNIPAVTADTWQWLEVDLSTTANGDKDVISDNSIELSAAGAVVVATRATQCYFDFLVKWDSTEEDALGVAVRRDGILGVVNTESGASLAEYTDYAVHEESGVDFLIWITDQSAADLVALAAY